MAIRNSPGVSQEIVCTDKLANSLKPLNKGKGDLL